MHVFTAALPYFGACSLKDGGWPLLLPPLGSHRVQQDVRFLFYCVEYLIKSKLIGVGGVAMVSGRLGSGCCRRPPGCRGRMRLISCVNGLDHFILFLFLFCFLSSAGTKQKFTHLLFLRPIDALPPSRLEVVLRVCS